MTFIKKDTYICPSCGAMFPRKELGDKAPEKNMAITERDNIHCPNCGKLGMIYKTDIDQCAMFLPGE